MAMETPPPLVVWDAILAICNQALRQETRLWIDAEQQVFQASIDAWTTDLMRKYNRGGKALVYNTFQAYLKATPANITKHLKIAQEEGWTLGIKQVRGAYIANEPRHLIHDTMEDTHAAYNAIVQSLLTKNFPGLDPQEQFPSVQLMLASHNEESVKAGHETWRNRKEKGLPTIKMEIAQLQGMADEVSCGLVQKRQQMTRGKEAGVENIWYPRAFKCLCWGGTQECIQFLIRRVTENRGSLERTKHWMAGLKKELWRRIKASVGLR
jgi:proline dehydrogenase